MPLGIVSDEDWEKELSKKDSTLERTIIEKGRGEGNKNCPSELRELIAEEKILGTSAKEIKNAFPVSASSISAYARGVNSTANYNDKNKPVTARKRIAGKVQNRMLDALNFLTDDKISERNGLEISNIVKNLATVAEKINGKEGEEKGRNVHLHLYGPKVKQLNDLDIIDVVPE